MRNILVGGADFLARGVSDLTTLRPVLAQNAGIEEMMVGNATLRLDEWRTIDAKVNEVMRERLTIADDLRSRGLVVPVSLGTILRVTERMNGMDEATVGFDGDTSPTKDRITFDKDTIPVPIISKDFDIGWRQLEASRQRGEALDTTSAQAATRSVRDRLQALITSGYGNSPGGMSIPGLITAADRLQVDLDADWDASGGDPIGDVVKMLARAYAVNLFGPFVFYLPKNYWATVQRDYVLEGSTVAAPTSRTILERIKAFSEVADVRPLDALPDDNVVAVQMTSDVIDFSEAQAITTVQWEKNPFVTHFRVLTVGGPHIKTTITAATGAKVNGIIHLRAGV